ncbi:hypothetical protein EDD21DRAFT_53057 [Dissophora ornata]|nr:hypothetical protein EDD21DRAFT_53057 [Dissophora ornata]
MMRVTDAGLEDFMEEIEREHSRPAPDAAVSSATQSAEPTPAIRQPTRKFTTDKTADEKNKDFMQTKEAYHGGSSSDLGINPQGVQAPLSEMTARSGSIDLSSREGQMMAPTPGVGVNIDIQRQTPTQEMSVAMIEASQGIRQYQEQQTQTALTDRVKKLSKGSDSSDRERFVRSLPPGAFTEEPISEMDVDSPVPRSESPTSSLPSQQDVVLQIAHRVSMQLREAQQRGDSTMDYHTLIAQEVEREQKAGVLPSTPTGSRSNSFYKSKAEDESSPRLVATPDQSRQSAAVEEPFDRNVKVFRPPADNATPLSNQIELPDDFYTLTSQDVMKLMNNQKAKREQEENRGFKTAAARAEEEKARERRYPKTVIRIRFPDRVQLQATFRSQETVGDLRKWVASACVGHGEKFDLYTTPPKKILADNKQTLYQAGLAPQTIVYFSWADSKLNQNSPFLNGQHMMKMEDLPIPGKEPEETKPVESQSPDPDQTLNRSGSMPMMTREDRRMSARMSTDKPGGGSSGGLPKWMKLTKK